MINRYSKFFYKKQRYEASSRLVNEYVHYPPLFNSPSWGGGIPFEFLDETYPAKTRGLGLLYGENCMMLTLIVFDWSTRVTDGQTDGRTDLRWHIARSACCRALIIVISLGCHSHSCLDTGWLLRWSIFHLLSGCNRAGSMQPITGSQWPTRSGVDPNLFWGGNIFSLTGSPGRGTKLQPKEPKPEARKRGVEFLGRRQWGPADPRKI